MENEKAAQLGTRLSFYDTQLDHITQYYVFSAEYVRQRKNKTAEKIYSSYTVEFCSRNITEPYNKGTRIASDKNQERQ